MKPTIFNFEVAEFLVTLPPSVFDQQESVYSASLRAAPRTLADQFVPWLAADQHQPIEKEKNDDTD